MNPRLLALSVLTVLAATSAAAYAEPAGTIFDNITGNSTTFNYDGYGSINEGSSAQATEVAQEFLATNATVGTLSLVLTADNPNDGGSISVYIIPASTDFKTDGTLGSAIPVATIADSTLQTTPSNNTNWTTSNEVSVELASTTLSAGYYWIVLDGTSSSFEWWVSAADPYTGTADLAGNNSGGWGSFPIGSTDGYAANLAVPEPATIALLGVGLAGLGWTRRRKFT